jgi:hypothetical protein
MCRDGLHPQIGLCGNLAELYFGSASMELQMYAIYLGAVKQVSVMIVEL